jgi:Protein of unknown function (DUF1614)
MTSVCRQKCTRSGPRDWIRRSESRQAGRSLAWPDGSRSLVKGPGLAYTRLGAPVVPIGGAGTFDGVVITGIIAVLLASLL